MHWDIYLYIYSLNQSSSQGSPLIPLKVLEKVLRGQPARIRRQLEWHIDKAEASIHLHQRVTCLGSRVFCIL